MIRRPALHFAPASTWANDPNGLIWHAGAWHLFFQHNPFGTGWGNMSWGHASAPDLFAWTEHDVALPATDSEEIFSGSCVFDAANSSGLGTAANPPLVAVYTAQYRPASPRYGTQAQALAVSLDAGLSWTPYAGNPVLDRGSKDFRDPKVIRYADHWVMVAVEAEDRYVVFYRSDNLIDWRFLSRFGPAHAVGGAWECPDLFELPVEGSAERRWVLLVSINPGSVAGGGGTQYFVGDFDGVTFTPDRLVESTDLRAYDWLDHGRDYYAAVSFADVPDGRRILLGWMSNWDYCRESPLTGGRGMMSVARELSLVRDGDRVRLRQQPVRELGERLGPPATVLDDTAFTGRRQLKPLAAGSIEIELSRVPSRFEVVIGGAVVSVAEGVLSVDRSRAGLRDFHPDFAGRSWVDLPVSEGPLRMTIVVDAVSVEVFAADGLACLTNLVYFDEPAQPVTVGGDDPVGLTVRVRTA